MAILESLLFRLTKVALPTARLLKYTLIKFDFFFLPEKIRKEEINSKIINLFNQKFIFGRCIHYII